MQADSCAPTRLVLPKLCAMAAMMAGAGNAQADTPAFDRPGIAFSVTTLPAGTVSWEQGLPDLSRDRAEGVTRTEYSAGSLLRVGLAGNLELQVGHAAFNALRVSGSEASLRTHGAGDTSVALKLALPALADKLEWALLGSTTLATGNSAFTAGDTAYALGVTLDELCRDNPEQTETE